MTTGLWNVLYNPNSSFYNQFKKFLPYIFSEINQNIILVGDCRITFKHGTHFLQYDEKIITNLNEKIEQMKRCCALIKSLDNKIIPFKVIDAFKLGSWPTHKLMISCKKQVSLFLETHQDKNLLIDKKDLLYQTLFRLTTVPISEAFDSGDKLDYYLGSMGVYQNWRQILKLDSNIINKFNLNDRVLAQIVEEQKSIILNRLKNTNMSKSTIQHILKPGGIFNESDWFLVRNKNLIFAQRHNKKIPVYFREISPDFAKEVHRIFHYIHTPRAEFAYGLFLDDSKLPFSIVAFDKLEREYKKMRFY